jgi:hypothetical protein
MDHNQQQPNQQPQIVYIKQAGNACAVASLIVGLIGLMFGLAMFILFPIALALGAAAIALGIIGRRKAAREPQAGKRTMATWGVVLGVATFACGVAGAVVVQNAVDELDRSVTEASEQFDRDMEELDREAAEAEREAEQAAEELDREMEDIQQAADDCVDLGICE